VARELAYWGGSDLGRVRADNEDAFAIGDLDAGALWDGEATAPATGPRGALLVVCDGMGGAAGGEVASELAARTVWRELLHSQPTDEIAVFARLLRRAVRAANRRVWDEAQRERTLRGMGTTLSAVGFVGRHAVIAQVGDSRAYVLRGGVLVQVTRDQSLVSALVSAGRVSQRDADHVLGAGAILQAVGVDADVEVSVSVVELRRGDRLLVCTDGLHGQVADGGLATVLEARRSPRDAVESLVAAARAAGGNDNATAVVCDVGGDALSPPASEDDLPRFAELDPGEEGDRAIRTTSTIVRRLAARVGIGDDPGPPVVPATGQHAIVRVASDGAIPLDDLAAQAAGPGRDDAGPGRPAVPGRRRRLVAWAVLLGVAAVAGWLAAGAW
jgi:serine/threonine protein phosphatase PrpC